jgi:hypothetical protein
MGTDVSLTFLTPLGGLLALGALVTVAAGWLAERRASRVRGALELRSPPRRAALGGWVALVAFPCVLGLAASQPVLRFTETHRVRSDAQAFYVFDVSRSMLASPGPEGRTRLQRAAQAALRMRSSLREVPSGVATMTDRILPELFPTPNEDVFTATVEQSVGIETPPPRGSERVGTLFAALDTLAGTNFFDPAIKRRLVVVLTDGESRPYDERELHRLLSHGPRTRFVIVRFWRPDERVWSGRRAIADYRPEPESESQVRRLAGAVEGTSFAESDLASATREARRLIGTGPFGERGQSLTVVALARWLALAALVPLAFLLWRRNLT